MSDIPQTPPPRIEPLRNLNPEAERTKQVTVAGWTAGVTAVAVGVTMINAPEWPVAFGLSAVAAMVAVVCRGILKR